MPALKRLMNNLISHQYCKKLRNLIFLIDTVIDTDIDNWECNLVDTIFDVLIANMSSLNDKSFTNLVIGVKLRTKTNYHASLFQLKHSLPLTERSLNDKRKSWQNMTQEVNDLAKFKQLLRSYRTP